jgi:hypothetical protein
MYIYINFRRAEIFNKYFSQRKQKFEKENEAFLGECLRIFYILKWNLQN